MRSLREMTWRAIIIVNISDFRYSIRRGFAELNMELR